MDAKDNPVVRRGRRGSEVSTEDFGPIERKTVNLEMPREPESFISLDNDAGALADEEAYYAELAFMEEPVTIHIHKPSGKNPPNTVQCFVNGKGAEHLRNNKWMICGWLPIGVPVTTRRKYVEVLARAKRESVDTKVQKYEDYEENLAVRSVSSEHSFNIIRDDNPRGRDWISRILMEY